MTVQRLHASGPPLPLHGAAASRRIEQRAAAALPPHALMQRAGRTLASLAQALAPHAERIWVAAGPGNNGGDGLEAAGLLHQAGRSVRVTLAAERSQLPADAAASLQRALHAGVSIEWLAPGSGARAAAQPLFPHDIAIDALLGLGAGSGSARRPPDAVLAALMRQLGEAACPVLSVDLPSGLYADSGDAAGCGAAVRATHTLSLLTMKPGLFTGSGRQHAGEVWFDDLGSAAAHEPPDAWLTGHDPGAWPARSASSHKGSFGDVAVVGGAAGMTGAALLAARAAHAAGAGRVFVDLLAPAGDPLDALRPELMFRAGWSRSPGTALATTTVVCGCGGGDAVRPVLPRLLGGAPRLVLDADALNAVAADTALQALLAARAGRGAATVLTPHPLEAARLLGCSTAELQADRLAGARRLADRFQCSVVLKGSGSVIAAPGRLPCINATGNAALASAGTGDVLAGWIGGGWAQWPADATAADDAAHAVACRAVAAHGAAAEPERPGSLRAADLIETLHRRLRRRA